MLHYEKTATQTAAKNENAYKLNNKMLVTFDRVELSEELKNYIVSALTAEARKYGSPSNVGGIRDNNGRGGKIYGDYICQITYVYNNDGRQIYRVYSVLGAQLMEYSALDIYYNRKPSRVEQTKDYSRLPWYIPHDTKTINC